MGTRNAVSKIVLIFVLLLTGCSSRTKEVPVTVEVTREVPITVEVTSEPVALATEAALIGTEVRRLHSSAVDQDYTIQIALPPSYAISVKPYPVVYVLAGGLFFGLTTDTVRQLNFMEELPELIVVGIRPSIEWDPCVLI